MNNNSKDNVNFKNHVSQKSILSPGTILRNAREQSEMSVQDAAHQLFLETRVIRALEVDKYDVLPPCVFVRGYLRSYAKLQEIPQKTVMDSFETMIDQQPTLSPKKLPQLKPQFKQNTFFQDLLLPVVELLVVLIIVSLMWLFYTTNNVYQSPEESWLLSDTSLLSEPESVLPIVAIPIKVDSLVATEASTEFSTNPSSILRIHFKEKAWMMIVDKEDKKLYQGIGNSGEILSLEGSPPFNVKVGNFAGVDIEYNGQIDNIKAFPKSSSRKRTFIIG